MKKATFLEDSQYREGWQALWTLCRQDWRGDWGGAGHVGRYPRRTDPAGGEKSRVCWWSPSFWVPNNVRTCHSCFIV